MRGSLHVLFAEVRKHPVGVGSATVVGLLVLLALLAPIISPYNPLAQDVPSRLSPPSLGHPFGTDDVGRDYLSRILYGSRASLAVAAGAVLLGTIPGALLGVVSAYFGGRIDAAIQTVMDAFLTMPALVIGLVTVAVLGPSLGNVIVAISIVFVPVTNRVVRSAGLQVVSMPYVEAARAVGCGPVRIIIVHVLRNCLAPYLVIASALVVDAIVVEAALSFLGFGIPPPNPSLGQALKRAVPLMEVSPWLVAFPAAVIGLVVFSTSLLADFIRDRLDPRLRHR